MRKSNIGMTLIELMIVVVILGILAAIAYPSYQQHVMDTRRASAQACLVEQAQYFERYFTSNMSYEGAVGDDGENWPSFGCTADTTGFYQFSPGTPGTRTFTLTATPQGPQASNDRKCGCSLTLDQAGTRGVGAETCTVASCW